MFDLFPLFRRRPSFDWIQVEVSSRCNAACRYCPHTIYRQLWLEEDMSLELFCRLLPAFRFAPLVYLQGWGEPFLNPHFFEMVRLVHKAGSLVGTTTNGTLVAGDMLERCFDPGLDIVAFSLAGTGAQNDFWRRGTSLEKVLSLLHSLKKEKARRGSKRPLVHVAYLLLRSNASELLQLPVLLDGLEISQVVVSTLDFVPVPSLTGESFFTAPEEEVAAVRELCRRVVEEGRRRGLKIHCRLGHPGVARETCPENVQRVLFVGVDGYLSPCVFAHLPLVQQGAEPSGGIRGHVVREGPEPSGGIRAQEGGPGSGGEFSPVRSLSFGRIQEEELTRAWFRPAWVTFRQSFVRGETPQDCRHCGRLYGEEIGYG